MVSTEKKKAEIWAVGGGKGGTGKSFVISSAGIYLALKGKRVVLIDADLGGANLHTFLGINRPRRSLTDFFENKSPLTALVVDSGVKNMGLVAGPIYSLAPDSIKYTQKLKFLRHIRALRADYVLIDLGAGIHFNTIDTFLTADKMLAVIVPEIISIENMYYFMKNALYRKLVRSLSSQGYRNLVENTWKDRRQYSIENLSHLIDHLRRRSNPISEIVDREVATFRVNLVLNKARSSQDIRVGTSVKSICIKYLGLDARYVGYVEHDNFISRATNKRQAYMTAHSASRCAKEIEAVVENLRKGRHIRTKI
jgi:flagellar biosynthesis protein FlhG